MDSHVEVPKVIYKQFFCDNKQFFYRIDISKSLITFISMVTYKYFINALCHRADSAPPKGRWR